MIARAGTTGLILFALAHAQPSTDSSPVPTGSQTAIPIAGIQATIQNDIQDGASSSSASLLLDPTQQASWKYMPTSTSQSPLSTTEQPSFVFVPSKSSVKLTTTTGEAMAFSFAPTSTSPLTAIPSAQETSSSAVTPGPSSVTAETSFNIELGTLGTVQTVQTMQTQTELKIPSSNYNWAPTSTTSEKVPLYATGVIYAPHLEQPVNTLEEPQATPSSGASNPATGQQPAAMPVYEAPQSLSGDADAAPDVQQAPSADHGSNTATAAPAYSNKPAQALPTTLALETSPATTSSEASMMQGIDQTASTSQAFAPTNLLPAAFMSIMAGIFPLGDYSSPINTAAAEASVYSAYSATPANTVPTTHSALVYDGQTVQMSGITLAAQPTSSSWTPDGGNNLVATGTVQPQPQLANSAARVISLRLSILLMLAAVVIAT